MYMLCIHSSGVIEEDVMARVKTLYVRDEDAATWEEAAKAAADEGMSMSEFATVAVRERLDRRPPAFELLTAESMEPLTPATQVKRQYQFWGRWIVKDVHSANPGASHHDLWSVAITKGGVFVAHVLRAGGIPLLGTDPDFGELQRKFLIPPDVGEAALEILKTTDWVVRRDI
jgi:hypothetical protein